jgi:hypothetical protein
MHPGASFSGSSRSRQPANLLNRLGRHVDIGRDQRSQILLRAIQPGNDWADITRLADQSMPPQAWRP